MKRKILTAIVLVVLLTGCGAQSGTEPVEEAVPSSTPVASTVLATGDRHAYSHAGAADQHADGDVGATDAYSHSHGDARSGAPDT